MKVGVMEFGIYATEVTDVFASFAYT